MGSLIAALCLFGAVAAAVAAVRASGAGSTADHHHGLACTPPPGPRDVHAVAGTTLAPAYVPNWG